MISALSPIQRLFVYDSLNRPKELQLKFRASEHGFSAQKFH